MDKAEYSSRSDNGVLRQVASTSKQLKKAELAYTVTEEEC